MSEPINPGLSIGDPFWIRSSGRVYFGKIVGKTPGGRKLVCEFLTEIPRISGHRRQRLKVMPGELADHKMFNVPWELGLGEGRASRRDKELEEKGEEEPLFEEAV